jgi:hypothetical protein
MAPAGEDESSIISGSWELGIVNRLWQFLHLADFPAYSSGARNSDPQAGQLNTIVMMKSQIKISG